MSLGSVHEPAHDIPVASVVDVAVVGGGCAGLAAAIAAARNGARVALVERLPFLGGCVTATLMDVFWMFRAGERKAVEGIGMELLRRLKENGATDGQPGYRMWVDTEKFKVMCDQMVAESGIELWLHTFGAHPIMDVGAVVVLTIESKSGRQAIVAQVVVDATGDGDIAAWSGAAYEMGRLSDGRVQPVSNCFRVANVDFAAMREYYREHPDDIFFARLVKQAQEQGEFTIKRNRMVYHLLRPWGEVDSFNATRVFVADPTDVRQMTAAEVEARHQVYAVHSFLRKYVPGFAHSEVSYIGAQVACRESRRIIGEYILTENDVVRAARFTDVIAKFPCFMDVHNPAGNDVRLVHPKPERPDQDVVYLGLSAGDAASLWETMSKPAFMPGEQAYRADQLEIAEGATFDIPYRALVPLKVDGLLVAGRCISSTHEAVGAIRYLPASFATGEAAGTAAALSILANVRPRVLDVPALQKRLVERGAYLGGNSEG
jgi:hypothetical protein